MTERDAESLTALVFDDPEHPIAQIGRLLLQHCQSDDLAGAIDATKAAELLGEAFGALLSRADPGALSEYLVQFSSKALRTAYAVRQVRTDA